MKYVGWEVVGGCDTVPTAAGDLGPFCNVRVEICGTSPSSLSAGLAQDQSIRYTSNVMCLKATV